MQHLTFTFFFIKLCVLLKTVEYVYVMKELDINPRCQLCLR